MGLLPREGHLVGALRLRTLQVFAPRAHLKGVGRVQQRGPYGPIAFAIAIQVSRAGEEFRFSS